MATTNYFCANLLFLRESAKLKQADIEARTGIKRNTWSNWENGKSEPSLENLFKIANFFSVDVGNLLSKNLASEENLSNNPEFDTTKDAGDLYQKRPCNDCIVKEEMLALQKQTIEALQGQVSILQRAFGTKEK